MNDGTTLVEFGAIRKMLDNDPDAIQEFSVAAQQSFSSFKREFRTHMHNRDLKNLKKVGHRIKPIAQMLGVNQLVDYYYQAKETLRNTGSEQDIEELVTAMDSICNKIMHEFKAKLQD